MTMPKRIKPKPEPQKPIVALTIHNANEMTKEERRHVAEWLRMSAKQIVANGDEYAKRFIARLF